jgi:hypothetical protein
VGVPQIRVSSHLRHARPSMIAGASLVLIAPTPTSLQDARRAAASLSWARNDGAARAFPPGRDGS